MLPEKLSELLELALADLEVVKALPGYHINMQTYYRRSDDDSCQVCLAGACMVNQGLVVDWLTSSDRYREIRPKMFAISHAVFGSIGDAVNDLGVLGDYYHLDRDMVYYNDAGWDDYMGKIIKDLKEVGQ